MADVPLPAWALGALSAAGVPDHALSLVVEPFGLRVESTEARADLQELFRRVAEWLAMFADAQADGRICHVEAAKLREAAGQLAAVALGAARSGGYGA